MREKPSTQVIYVDTNSCEPSPLSSQRELGEAEELLLIDQMKQKGELLEPCFGIEYNGICQVFLGAYQLPIFRKCFPGKRLPIEVGVQGQFTPKIIALLQLSPLFGPHEGSYDGSYLAKATMINNLRKHYGFSDQDLAEHTGLNRATISQIRRLPTLHSSVRRHLRNNIISFSIAREMLSVDRNSQLDLINEIVKKKLNISQVRKLLKRSNSATSSNKESSVLAITGSDSDSTHVVPGNRFIPKTQDVRTLENRITEDIGYPVSIDQIDKNQGSISIRPFDELGLEVISKYLSKDTLKHRVRLVVDFDSQDELDETIGKMMKDEW